MKHRIISSLCLAGMLAGILSAEEGRVYFAESFRRGPTRVTEATLEVKLTPQERSYRERIKDLRGNDRYEFILVPQGPEGDTKVTSWQARLRDLHHTMYDNVLRAEQQPSAAPENNLWWLNPDSYAAVPIRAVRVIKVDGFYVELKVTDYHRTPLDSPYLDSMVLRVKFSNTDPRVSK